MSVINVKQQSVTVDVDGRNITLDIASGGIVPAVIDTTLIASTSISALRCITTDGSGQAKYATPDTLANAVVIGVSTTSGTAGQNITIKTSGQLTDASWNWTKGSVYLGANGVLTQTPASGGDIIVHVARAITATTIIIDIDTLIQTV